MSRNKKAFAVSVLLAAATMAGGVHAETREEWIALAKRVHGGFGSYLPVGIRIGLDALSRLNAKPREVTVTYFDNPKAPCACFADGIALATVATVGQRTLILSPELAPQDALAVVVVKHKQTGVSVRYTVPAQWMETLTQINRTKNETERYDEVMNAQGLFEVSTQEAARP